jgi:hypothetical protein
MRHGGVGHRPSQLRWCRMKIIHFYDTDGRLIDQRTGETDADIQKFIEHLLQGDFTTYDIDEVE